MDRERLLFPSLLLMDKGFIGGSQTIKGEPFGALFFLWHNKKNGIYMKSLQHHVRKLAKLMTEADNLIDTNKARKLIKKAEQRAEKIRKRCQQQQQCREDDIESTE